MSQSLAPECTPLKHAYDACFNNWFAGYLQPPQSSSNPNGRGKKEGETDTEAQIRDYEEKCGKAWRDYRSCLLKAVNEKRLDDVLDRAREEAPLRDIKAVDEEP